MAPRSLTSSLLRVSILLLFSLGMSVLLACCIAGITQGEGFCSVVYFVCPALIFTALLRFLLRATDGVGAIPTAIRSSALSSVSSDRYVCSFCAKSHAEVHKLITGPGVNICNRCVVVCKNLLDAETKPDWEL